MQKTSKYICKKVAYIICTYNTFIMPCNMAISKAKEIQR